VILVIVVGTIRLVGSNANNVFSNVLVRSSDFRSTGSALSRGKHGSSGKSELDLSCSASFGLGDAVR
jgi:hypothetical protein